MVELFNLLELLHPDVFTTTQPFESCFNLKENHVEKEMLLKAKNLLDLFMIRRLKSRVEKLLPARLETQVYCPLSKDQAFLYKAILLKDASVLDRVDRSDDEHMSHANRIILQNLFMQLRKASQHPWMFDGMRSSDATLQDMVAASGKLAVLDMLLRSLYKKGHRVVIFSQFTSTLDILEEYCYARGWKNCRLDGGVARAARDFVVRRFQDTDSQLFLFLMSTKSGGVGLNLQAADTCIIYDSDWNPQNDLQAMARVHRIGQTKVVHVYRLISSGSVEERMIERASKKLLLDQSVNRETSSGGNTGGLAAKDLLNDIKFGASAIFGGKTLEDLPSWKDIEHITNRDRKESDSVGKLKGGTEYNGATFKAENKFTEGQVFKGLDFRKIREENERKTLKETPKTLQGIGRLWQSIKAMEGKKREKKSRLIMVEGKGSGYGKEFVPVLASNNYDLLKGESSVFGRELKSSQRKHAALPSKKEKFENASHCQFCLDGGLLYCCQYCPVALHLNCCGINNPKDFKHCFHHHCSGCNKNTQEVGGLLFRCAICPWAWCESCVPTGKDVRYLDSHERWDELGYNSSKNAIYIHCSAECERYAKKEFNWKPEVSKVCPDSLDLSYNFGAPKVDVESKPTAREVSSSSSFSSDEGGLSNSSSENDNVISLV
jgi:SWI/SNF-related matrix-associated actin-dependent regulator of chromatin subfamily A member 5